MHLQYTLHALCHIFLSLAPYIPTDQNALDAIYSAMEAYNSQTCISFQEKQNEEDYVRFFSGNG